MQTITFCSFKGGTSKTSTALHLGACLATFHNKKVLLIDFDPQANLSIGLGVGPDCEKTLSLVLQGKEDIANVIVPTSTSGLSIIPANTYLDGLERVSPLVSDPYAHERLRRTLVNVDADYDYCLIDTPPNLGWLTQSAFFASHHSIICAIPEAYSILALRRLKEFHDSIQQYHPLEVLGVVLSFWDKRGAVNDAFLQEIDATFPKKVLENKVRRDVAVSRAVLEGKPVLEYDPSSRAAEDYIALTKEILKRAEG